MHTQEFRELTDCCDCGAVIEAEAERPFTVSDDEVLCFECAVRRGGVYDAAEDRWTVAPDVADLPDERRPHP